MPQPPRVRRPRAVLASALVVTLAASAVLAGCALVAPPPISTIGRVDFATALPIPPLADSTVSADGTRVFELVARAGESEFRAGVGTPTWGFDSGEIELSYLGPTLRAERGERVAVELRNELDEATTVHWHGMHLPPAMDGGPHQMVDPGASWTPSWEIDQPAATLWYHPHPHGATERHVRNGLAGLFLLDDEIEAALPLPRDYGVDDVPVIVQDVEFQRDGRLSEAADGFVGTLGDELLVNGALGPYLEVTTEVVRLRLLNASTARSYSFELADAREFAQIATDGGLLEQPLATSAVQLSPGERAEILVTVEAGETVVLQSHPQDLGATVPFGGSTGGGDSFDVLELRAAPALESRGAVPASLAPIERLDPLDATAHRSFELDGTSINNRSMDMSRIDEVVELGATEIWSVTNSMAFPHNFHIHDVQFQVVSIAGSPPPPALAGWKDTVYLRPHEEYRLVMRFEDHADAEHPYMYHCHLLQHEDAGMMGQFLVVEAGQVVPERLEAPTMGDDHDH